MKSCVTRQLQDKVTTTAIQSLTNTEGAMAGNSSLNLWYGRHQAGSDLIHWNKEELGILDNKSTFHLHSKLRVFKAFSIGHLICCTDSPLMQIFSYFTDEETGHEQKNDIP